MLATDAIDGLAREQIAAGRRLSIGWRAPGGMRFVLAVNALLIGLLTVGFTWTALYPWLGGETTEPTVLGIGFTGMSTTFDLGDTAAMSALALLSLGGTLWLLWMARRGPDRLVVDRDGVALRTRGRSRYAWSQIDHFEVATLVAEGVVQMEEVDGHCGVVVLCSGERIAIKALRTWTPFGTHHAGDVAAHVHTLNTIHQARIPV